MTIEELVMELGPVQATLAALRAMRQVPTAIGAANIATRLLVDQVRADAAAFSLELEVVRECAPGAAPARRP